MLVLLVMLLLSEGRRDWNGKLCRPALIVAVAARETGDARKSGVEWLMCSGPGVLCMPLGTLPIPVAPALEREDTGSELRSGIPINASQQIPGMAMFAKPTM
jgi:hypothetical protein